MKKKIKQVNYLNSLPNMEGEGEAAQKTWPSLYSKSVNLILTNLHLHIYFIVF